MKKSLKYCGYKYSSYYMNFAFDILPAIESAQDCATWVSREICYLIRQMFSSLIFSCVVNNIWTEQIFVFKFLFSVTFSRKSLWWEFATTTLYSSEDNLDIVPYPTPYNKFYTWMSKLFLGNWGHPMSNERLGCHNSNIQSRDQDTYN